MDQAHQAREAADRHEDLRREVCLGAKMPCADVRWCMRVLAVLRTACCVLRVLHIHGPDTSSWRDHLPSRR